jgi:hypothetical protein
MVHRGHALPAWRILRSRWRGGRFQAAGTLLKLHGFKRNGWRVWHMFAHPLLLAAMWMVAGIGTLMTLEAHSLRPEQWIPASFAALAIAHWGLKRDLRHVLTAWMDWHLLMLGIAAGVLRPLRDRAPTVAHRVVADGTARAVDRRHGEPTSALSRPLTP